MSTPVGYRDLDPRFLGSVAGLLDQVQALTIDQGDEGATLVGQRFADQVTIDQFYDNLFSATDGQLAANAPIIFASEIALLLRTVMGRRATEIIFRDIRDKFVPNPPLVYQQFKNAGYTASRIQTIITSFEAMALQQFLQYVGGQNFRLYGPVTVDEAMIIMLPVTALASLTNRQLFELLYTPVIQQLTVRGRVIIPFTGPVYAFDPNAFVSEALRIADTIAEKQLVVIMQTEQILHQLMNIELFVLPINARALLDALNTQFIVTANPGNTGQGDGTTTNVFVTVTGNDPINLILPTVLANTPAYVTALTTAISNQSVVQNDLDRIMILFVPPITRDGLGRVNYNLILNQPGSAAILANLYNQLIVLPAASRAAYLRNLASNATPGTSQYVIYNTLASALTSGPLPPLNNVMIVANILALLNVPQSSFSAALYNQLVSQLTSDLLSIQNTLTTLFPNNFVGARNYVQQQASNFQLSSSLRGAYVLFYQTFASTPPLNNLIIVTNTLPYLGTNINNISQTLRQQLVSRSSSDLTTVQNALVNMFPNNVPGAQAYVINNANTTTSLGITYGLYAQTFASIPPLNNLMIVTNTLPYLGTNINNISQSLRQQLVSRSSSDLSLIQDTLANMFQNNVSGAQAYVINNANTTTSLGITYGLYAQTFASIPPLNNLMIVTNTLPYLGTNINNISQTLRQQLVARPTSDLTTIQNTLATLFPNVDNIPAARSYVISQANTTTSLGITYGLYAQTFASIPPLNNLIIVTNTLPYLGSSIDTISYTLRQQLLSRSSSDLSLIQDTLANMFPNNVAGAQAYVINNANNTTSLGITYGLYAQSFSNNKTVIATQILQLINVNPATVPTQFASLVNDSTEANLNIVLGALQSLFPNNIAGARNYVTTQANTFSSIPDLQQTYARVANTFSSFVPVDETATLNAIFVLVGVAPSTVPSTTFNNILTLSSGQTVGSLTFLQYILTQLNAVVPATTIARQNRLIVLRNANFIPEQRAVYDAIIQQFQTGIPTQTNQQLLDQILAILGVSVVQFGVANYNAVINSTDPTVNLALMSILTILQGGTSSAFSVGATQQLRSLVLSGYSSAISSNNAGVSLVWTPLYQALSGL